MQQATPASKNNADPEVDFLLLARTLWNGRRLIGISIALSFVIGLAVAFLIPAQYTATCSMLSRISNPKPTQASLSPQPGQAIQTPLAAISVDSLSLSEFSPSSYAGIVTSVPFQLELMKTRLNFEKSDSALTLYDYFTKFRYRNPLVRYTFGLPSLIRATLRGDQRLNGDTKHDSALLQLTQQQIEVKKILDKQVWVFGYDKDGFVTLCCTLPEPLAAAQLTRQAQTLLQRYVTELKLKKSVANLNYVEQRFAVVKKDLQRTQQALADLRTRPQSSSAALARIEEERLSTEYSIALQLYAELAKKLELAKMQVNEDTPVFVIVKPVSVPIVKSSPNRLKIISYAAIFGILFSCCLILGQNFLQETKSKWIQSSL